MCPFLRGIFVNLEGQTPQLQAAYFVVAKLFFGMALLFLFTCCIMLSILWMFSKSGPMRHFAFPSSGHQFINCWDLSTHVPGVNFAPNPSISLVLFLNFCHIAFYLLCKRSCYGDPVSKSIVINKILLFTMGSY